MNLSFGFISLNSMSLLLILGSMVWVSVRSNRNSAKELLVLLGFILVATFSQFMELGSTSFETRLFWRNFSQIGIFIMCASTYAFVMAYTREKSPLYLGLIPVFYGITILAVALIYTNPMHHLMRTSVEWVQTADQVKLVVHQALLGKILVTLTTLMNLLSLIKMEIFVRTCAKRTRRQARLIMIGLLIPIVYTYLKNAILRSMGVSIPISTSFSLGVLVMIYGMFQYDFLAIRPIARNWVIDEINIGMIFFSPDGQVMDVNHEAVVICGGGAATVANKMEQMHPVWKKAIEKGANASFDIPYLFEEQKEEKNYRVTVHRLIEDDKLLGVVALIQDTSIEVSIRDSLRKRAELDSLTQVLNRGAFQEKVEELLKDRRVENQVGSLLVIDIDLFKEVNDRYGHHVGDRVIQEVVGIIQACSRSNDLIGRLGGDEFALFLTKCDAKRSYAVANRIRNRLDQEDLCIDQICCRVTVSIGGANYRGEDQQFQTLYERADEALYQAKSEGRHRACFIDTMQEIS